MIYYILEVLSRLIFGPYFRLRVYGKEEIPRKGAFILASNHASFLDPIILGIACPRKLNYMARDTLFRNILFGWLLRGVGSFPLKRDSADKSALKEALRRLANGGGLVLFPEGRRIRLQGEKTEPLAGVGFLAAKSRALVIPAYLKGTDKAMPPGARLVLPHKISLYFGKGFCVDSQAPYVEIAQLVMQKARLLEQKFV